MTENRNKPGSKSDEHYHGYQLKSPHSLPYPEDVEDYKDEDGNKVDTRMLKDIGRISKPLVVFTAFFAFSFVVLLIWLILIAKCKVQGLCDMDDRSAADNSEYLFDIQPFPVPTVYLWACLTASSLELFVMSVYGLLFLRRKVGTARMVQISSTIRQTSNSYLIRLFQVIFLPTIAILILLGLYLNWRVGASFWIGAALSSLVAICCVQVSARSNVRVAAAAQSSVQEGLQAAFQSASINGMSLICIGLVGVCGIYLVFEDVRALVGFAAGVSLSAFTLRVSGSIFGSAINVGVELFKDLEKRFPDDDPRNSSVIVNRSGNVIGKGSGLIADLFESYIISIVATAILGSLLPFPFRDPFSICIFNHLYIDDVCGPFGYPERLSYATYICSRDNLYIGYPTLRIWQSNAVFVALPFLVALIGVLASIVCTTTLYAVKKVSSEPDETTPHPIMLRRGKITTLLGIILMLAGTAGLCWGFFGPKSGFDSMAGFGSERNLLFFELADTDNSCVPLFDEPDNEPLPIPRGELTLGKYRPLSNLGFQYGAANQTAWRLYLCIIIGLGFGNLLQIAVTYFISSKHRPTKHVSDSGKYGAGLITIHAIGIGMSMTFVALILIVIAILGSFSLYGSFGIGLASVSTLSTLAITVATGTCHPVANDAAAIGVLAGLAEKLNKRTRALSQDSETTLAATKAFASGAAVISTYALFALLIQTSGLAPSPSQLVGSVTEAPSKLLADNDPVSVIDVYVASGIFLGILIPFVFTAFVLMGHRRVLDVVLFRLQGRYSTDVEGSVQRSQLDYFKSMNAATHSSLFESIFPLLISVLGPFALGFAFGQKALIGMLGAGIISSYMLSVTLASTGDSIHNAYQIKYPRPLKGQHTKDVGIENGFGNPLKDTFGPALNSLMKIMTLTGILFINRMQPDVSKGWIGLIIFIVTCGVLVLLTLWSHGRRKKFEADWNESKKKEKENPGAPNRMLSPFYEEGPMIDQGGVAPGSQVAQALKAVGSPSQPVDPRKIPGLANNYEEGLAEVPLV
eukprot:Plantae.Rhodophyta-Hildenbrandia_rubra.ctg7293.p1 GENE.Plantae.Rhodophyta-Hildenbrandia_rubra.ctg7293~~Plantae.Rhodophyta-Hildenbrandia_rubra.ctg7293.p1  ORF type:complete len:1030 (-),score=121.31 Plantae.Rhodophyta-Hildenbrandia_rubra.ctg7293:2491-5580(-)